MGLGRRAIGVDASPLGVAIARVRTTLLGEAGRERLVSRGGAHRRGVGRAGAQAAASRGAAPGPAGRSRAFTPHVLFELLGLRELVMATPDDDVGRALRLCLSSILVKFMKAGPEAPRDGADEADRARRPVAHAGRPRGGAGARPGGAGAANAGRHARARGDRRRRARAADRRPAARRWCCRRRPTPAPTTTPRIHDARFLWLGLSEKKFRRVQLGARGRARRRRRGRLVARPSRRSFIARDRARPAPGRPRAAGRRRRRRRRPRRERARRHRGRGRRRRAGAGRARLAGAPAARSPPGGDLRRPARAASTCCCSKRSGAARRTGRCRS